MTDENAFRPLELEADTPDDARDHIAAIIMQAATAVYEQAKGLKRKEKLRLGDQLTDISERITAIKFVPKNGS